MKPSRSFFWTLVTFVGLGVAASGCSAAAGPDDSTASEDLRAAPMPGVAVPNPTGAFDVSVVANGSGCPAGTWTADMGEDGQTLTARFAWFASPIEPGEAMKIQDCTIQVNLRGRSDLAFAVGEFAYDGAGYLDSPGMAAHQVAKYYFSGGPVPTNDNRVDMAGPYQDRYQLTNTVAPADLVWSACGATRSLSTQTRLIVQNNAAKTGWGSFNNDMGGDADIELRFRWKLLSRDCRSPSAG